MLGIRRRTGAPHALVTALVAGSAVVLGGLTNVTPAAALDPSPAVVFDNLEAVPDGNYPSVGFQATSTNELGDLVELGPGPRTLDSVTVQMSSWACQTGTGTGCTTTPGATFAHPLTLSVYAVGGTEEAPALGSVLYRQTNTFAIPYRPSANTLCPGDTGWTPNGGANCYSGYAFQVTFDATPAAVELPERVIWSLQFNTETRGYTPLGVSGPYNSLNVAVFDNPVLAGANADPGDVWMSTTWAGAVCDGPSNGTFGRDFNLAGDCWTGYQPLGRITTTDEPAGGTTTIYPHATKGWAFVRENPAPTTLLTPVIATAPVVPPAPFGAAAANIATADGSEGKTWVTPQFDGVRLADLTELSYRVLTDELNIAPSLGFDIRYRINDKNYGGRLVFEPVYNGGITTGTWHTFDALAAGTGNWWSSNQGANGSNGLCQASSGPAACTWAEILATFPNAQIDNPSGSSPGNLVVKLGSGAVGSPDPAISTYVDGITVGVGTTTTTFDFETACSTTCYVDDDGDDGNSGLTPAEPLRHIQTAIDVVAPGGTVHVAAGTYAEDVNVTKSVDLLGAGASATTIVGQIGGPLQAAVRIGASDVLVEGFTITRAGNSVGQWFDAGLNTFGVLIDGANDVEVRNNVITQNRTGLDVRGAGLRTGLSIHHNDLVDNRTGVNFFQGAPGLEFTNNSVTDNWTMGVLFQPDPAGSFAGAVFTDNDLSGNWFGGVVDRYPADSGFPLDFSGNHFGPGDVDVTTANSAESGYGSAGQTERIPVAFGGTAVAPASAPDVAGAGAESVDVTPFVVSAADQDGGVPGFVPDLSHLVVVPTYQTPPTGRINEAVGKVASAGTVEVRAGSYTEDVVLSDTIDLVGAGADVTTIVGVSGGQPGTVMIGASATDVLVEGFTLTRDNTDWLDPGLNVGGMFVQGAGAEIRNNVFTHNRTGFYVGWNNGVADLSIHNNEIVDNRTGVFFQSAAPGLQFTENTVSDNLTIGILMLNQVTTFGQFTDAVFTGNDLSGNWGKAVENRQLGLTGVDMSGNHFGAGDVSIDTLAEPDPAYDAQVPTWAGGTATPPPTALGVTGVGSAALDVTPYLDLATDTAPGEMGFQGDLAALAVSDTSFQSGSTERVQEAVDLVDAGGVVRLEAGTYPESSPVTITTPLDLIGPNAGLDPNDPADATLANPLRGPEATLHAPGVGRVLVVGAEDVTIDGLRFTDTPTGAGGDAQVPLIAAGGNFHPVLANGLSIVNNVFESPSRMVVYTNGPTELQSVAVDHNRVVTPTSLSGCTNTCGRQLFNLWAADDVSFQANSVIGTPDNTHRTRVLTVINQVDDMTDGLTIAGNTIRDACNFTCFTLSEGVTVAEVAGNDVDVHAGAALSFYQPGSGSAGAWEGGAIDVHHNVFVSTDPRTITVGNADSAVAFEPDLSGVSITRNAIAPGGIYNKAPGELDAPCNYWGADTGPTVAQLTGVGPIDAVPFLFDADLDADCGTVPGAPTSVAAAPAIGGAVVTWAAPADDGGFPVTGYTVTPAPDGDPCSVVLPDPLSCAFSGLTAGTEYTFTVTAHNAAGTGPGAADTATPQGVPSAPQDVEATSEVSAAIVTWAAPADDGDLAVTGYTVTAAPGGATCTTNALTCSFPGLDPGTEYTFSVFATNAAGDGPAADSNPVTPNGKPGAPVDVAATPGIGTVTVEWSAPIDDGGAPITSYTVTAAPGGDECVVTLPGALECVFADLDVATEYTFFVVATNAAGNGPGTLSGPASPQGVPGIPVVTATGLIRAGSVAWSAPAANGLPISGYTVTVSPGGATCTTTALSCTIQGLTGGVTHTFSVVASNAAGDSAPGVAAALVREPPASPGPQPVPDYVPVGPLRLFDTRGISTPVLETVAVAQIGPDNVLEVPVTGHTGGVPNGRAVAVSMNVTATNTTGNGFITVFPCGARPEASSVNYVTNTTVANAVISPISADGTVCFYSKVPVDIVVDLNGWFLDDDSRVFEPIPPTRVFDTRGTSAQVLTSVPVGRITGGTFLEVPFAGLGDGLIPTTGVGGVSLNVTATNSIASGYLTVFPCGELRKVSNVNFTGVDATVPNAVITPLSPTGTLCFYASRDVDVVVDINGWLSTESQFESLDPVRVADTRGQSPDALVVVENGKIGGSTELRLRLSDLGGVVPADGVGALSLNVTATETDGAGFVTVYPCGTLNQVSSVNFTGSGQTVANAVIAPVSDDGEICFYSKVATHLVVDLNGWASDTPYTP